MQALSYCSYMYIGIDKLLSVTLHSLLVDSVLFRWGNAPVHVWLTDCRDHIRRWRPLSVEVDETSFSDSRISHQDDLERLSDCHRHRGRSTRAVRLRSAGIRHRFSVDQSPSL